MLTVTLKWRIKKKIALQLRQWGKDQVKKNIYTFYISNFIFAGFLEVKEDI